MTTLEVFDGPLALLVELTKKHEINILKIRIVKIIDDFVTYVEEARKINLFITTEFLSMATYLLLLKSKLLLPKTEEQEKETISEINELFDTIKKYEMLKEAAQEMKTYASLQSKMHFRNEPDLSGKQSDEIPFDELDSFVLTEKLLEIIDRNRRREEIVNIARDRFNLDDKIKELAEIFKNTPYSEYSVLAEGKERGEAVTVFFALLIMAKRELLNLMQKENFGPIYIKANIDEKNWKE